MIRHNEIEVKCENQECGGSVVFGSNDIVGKATWNGKRCKHCNQYTHIRLWNTK